MQPVLNKYRLIDNTKILSFLVCQLILYDRTYYLFKCNLFKNGIAVPGHHGGIRYESKN